MALYRRNVLKSAMKWCAYSEQEVADIIFAGELDKKKRLQELKEYEAGKSDGTNKGTLKNWVKLAGLLNVDVDFLKSGNHAFEFAKKKEKNDGLLEKEFRKAANVSWDDHSQFSRTISGKGNDKSGNINKDMVIKICSYLNKSPLEVFPKTFYGDFYVQHPECLTNRVPSEKIQQYTVSYDENEANFANNGEMPAKKFLATFSKDLLMNYGWKKTGDKTGVVYMVLPKDSDIYMPVYAPHIQITAKKTQQIMIKYAADKRWKVKAIDNEK